MENMGDREDRIVRMKKVVISYKRNYEYMQNVKDY